MATFESLPYEIKFVVLSQTSLQDVRNFFQTNRSFANLCKRPEYSHLIQSFIKDQQHRYLLFGRIDQNQLRIFNPSCKRKFDLMKDILINPDNYDNINKRKADIRGTLAISKSKYSLIEHCWKLFIPADDTIKCDLTYHQLRQHLYKCYCSHECNCGCFKLKYSLYKLKYYYRWNKLTRDEIIKILTMFLFVNNRMI